MQPKCQVCYLRDRWVPIMSRARLLIWLSPLHRRSMLYMAPELAQVPYALVPSPVSSTDFYDMGLTRSGVLAVNAALMYKGGDLFVEWARAHPEERITLVGARPEVEVPPNVQYQGSSAFAEMNRLYNNHKKLLHLSERSQPFERTIAEAYLAGCGIVANANIGALSWPFFKHGRDVVARTLEEAPIKFWQAIEKVRR